MARETEQSKDHIGVHGYKLNLCRGTQGRVKCPICGHLMRKPIQTSRGELACGGCYKQTKGSSSVCPIDGEPIDLDDINFDKCKEKEILQLQCICSNAQYGCLWHGVVKDGEEHEESCTFKPQDCYICKEKIHPVDMSTHHEVCSGLIERTKCIYPNCEYQVSSPDDLKSHLENNMVYHNLLNITMMADMERRLKEDTQRETNAIISELNSLESTVNKLQDKMTSIVADVTRSQNVFENSLSQMQLAVDRSESNAHALSNDGPTNQIKETIERLSNSLKQVDKSISGLDLRQQLYENTSFDGRLLWKIDTVSARLQQAVTGRVTALHSAPAFSERYGYKFCGRLYLNGDGVGRGTHVSLFFVLMKSEHDNLLTWPFAMKVTVRMINQVDRTNDVIESFEADPNSSSFLKPVRDMNIASGCPRFIQRERFLQDGFVKDDMVFIEFTVATNTVIDPD